MHISCCAEVIRGCKLNVLLDATGKSTQSLINEAQLVFSEARSEALGDRVLSPIGRYDDRRSGFEIEEVVAFDPETLHWTPLRSEGQLFDGCQLYFFQQPAPALGIADTVDVLPPPVEPHDVLGTFLSTPSPQRRAPPATPDVSSPAQPFTSEEIRTSYRPLRGHSLRVVHTPEHRPKEVAVDASIQPASRSPVHFPDTRGDIETPLRHSTMMDKPNVQHCMSSHEAFSRSGDCTVSISHSELMRKSSSSSLSTSSQVHRVAAPAATPTSVLNALFSLLDTDGDGIITLGQLFDAMTRYNMDTSPSAVGATFLEEDRQISKGMFRGFVHRYWSVSVSLLAHMRGRPNDVALCCQ